MNALCVGYILLTDVVGHQDVVVLDAVTDGHRTEGVSSFCYFSRPLLSHPPTSFALS